MIKLLIGGDVAPVINVANSFKNQKFEFLNELRNIAATSDYFILNLESPIAESEDKTIVKNGPCLKAPKETIDALKYLRTDMVTLANNHILDYGEKALLRTQKLCESSNIASVGVGKNLTEAKIPRIIELKNKKIGIINCCEHEYSIAADKKAGANPLNPIAQWRTIRSIRENVDYIIVIVHGGHERFQLPSPRMCESYRFFIEAGADAVINHHQHCFSGYEFYQDKPIIYGLGNLIFENLWTKDISSWNYGYLVALNLDDEKISFDIHPYEQCVNGVNFKFLPEDAFDIEISNLNKIICDETLLVDKVNEYYKSEIKTEMSVLEPYTNRYLAALKRRHLLPSFLGNKYKIRLQNHIECESHQDKLKFALATEIFKRNNN